MTSTGWETYGAILRVNEELLAQERAQRPSTCPVDGHILEDVRGVLHCVFGGELYDYAGKSLYDHRL
jgi:hypothetical protein